MRHLPARLRGRSQSRQARTCDEGRLMSRRVTLNLGFQGNTRDVSVVIPDDEPTPWQWGDRLSVVGKPTPRVDGPLKATGAARYTYDIELPGMLYGAMLRSPWPHARIRSIDLSAAQHLAGVRAVFALDDHEIRFAGQEVAAVAAISSDIAADALKLIKVDYETLPFVVDMDAAAKGFRAARLRQRIQRRQDQPLERRRRAEGTRNRGEHDRGHLHDARADACLPRNSRRGRELQRGRRPASRSGARRRAFFPCATTSPCISACRPTVSAWSASTSAAASDRNSARLPKLLLQRDWPS